MLLFIAIGITAAPNQLQRCFKIVACPETGWEFVWVYRLHGNYQPIINSAELLGGDFWSLPHTRQLITEHPDQFAPSFVRIITESDTRQIHTKAG